MLAVGNTVYNDDTRDVSPVQPTKHWFSMTLIITIVLFGNGASASVTIHDVVTPVVEFCKNDMDRCRLPQSKSEIDWSDYCFPAICDTGIAMCITDTKTGTMHYICMTKERMTCKPGYQGKFLLAANKSQIIFEQIECLDGMYTKGEHDCRRPCTKLHIPDPNKFTVIRPGTKTGDPPFIECNREKFCPTNQKYGTRFYFNESISRDHVDVCGEIGKAPCLIEHSREVQTSTPSNQTGSTTAISHSPKTSTQVPVMPQDEKRSSNLTLQNDTRPSSTSSTQAPMLGTDHKPSPDIVSRDLTNMQLAIVIIAVLAGFVVVAFLCWLCSHCYKIKCARRKERSKSAKDSELGKTSQESMTTTNFKTRNYWKIHIKLDRKLVNTDISSTDTEETADEVDEVSSESNEITEKEPLFGKTDPLDQV